MLRTFKCHCRKHQTHSAKELHKVMMTTVATKGQLETGKIVVHFPVKCRTLVTYFVLSTSMFAWSL